MRIAILSTIQGYSWAGTEEVWFQFARLALESGHEVLLGADQAVVESEQVAELVREGLKTTGRRVFRPMRFYLLKQRLLPDMGKLKAFDPEVLLINSGSPLDHVYLRHLWRFVETMDCPKVYFCHFNSDRLQIPDREALRRDFQDLAGMVFVSRHNLELLKRQLAWDPRHAVVIANASRLVLKEPCPWPEGPVRLAHVARLETTWKGQDLLLECLAGEAWKEREWSLTLFGSGPDEDYIRRLIRYFKLQDRVRMGGYVRDMTEVYREHHALVLPSRGEGMPLAALEAMMCGRPVIATDVGGNAELIADDHTGFIAEAPTPHSFHRALGRAWEKLPEWKAMGEAAHLAAKQRSGTNPPARLLDFLESVCAEPRPPAGP